MGNNAAYSYFEDSVIAVYNKGVLDQELLSALMEIHRGCDIDSGGRQGTLTTDGLDCEEVVLKTFGVDAPRRPILPKNYKDWTPEQDAENEAYWDARYTAFKAVTNRFGWC